MYLHSILIASGNSQSQEEKLNQILQTLGFPHNFHASNNLNLLTISPAEEKLSIGIDQIRQLRLAIAIKPTNRQPKVVIIQNAETLTEEAQNALLKTLEEPPDNAYLILLTKNTDFLLPTVISRCQVIELPASSNLALSKKEGEELAKVVSWIEQGSIPAGFAWAAENTDRKSALETIDKLLIVAHQRLKQGDALQTASIRSIFEAKKYLLANTNVRLTLENLFLN